MFDVGVPELVSILVVALIVFGPGKLPEVGAALGKAIGEFRRATRAVNDEVQSITQFPEAETRPALPSASKRLRSKRTSHRRSHPRRSVKCADDIHFLTTIAHLNLDGRLCLMPHTRILIFSLRLALIF